MTNHLATTPACIAKVATLTLAALLLGTNANAQTLQVFGSDFSDNDIYKINFSTSSITIQNTDQSSRAGITSLHARPDFVGVSLDLLAADAQRRQILLYFGAVGIGQIVWDQSFSAEGPGGNFDGLSSNSAGHVYFTSSTQGMSDSEVWVLPNFGGPLVGGYGPPILVDNDFVVEGDPKTCNQLVETTVSIVDTDGFNIDDLLVLCGDPSRLFVYRADDLASVLLPDGDQIDPAVELLSPDDFPTPPDKAGGLAILLDDGSIVITTNAGDILNFDADGNLLANFAGGLGNGQKKIKAAFEASKLTVVVSDRNLGKIQKFQRDDPNSSAMIVATITGVQHPNGLALTNAVTEDLANCLKPQGCNPTGALRHQATGDLSGVSITDICIVDPDPRMDTGICNGALLSIQQECPNFPPIELSGTLCGASGVSGTALALLTVETTEDFTDGLVVTTAFADELFGADVPTCDEGESIGYHPADGSNWVDGDEIVEMTSDCFNPSIMIGRYSVFAAGVTTNLRQVPGATQAGKLLNFIIGKFEKLLTMIDQTPGPKKAKANFEKCIETAKRQTEQGKLNDAITTLDSCTPQGALDSFDGNPNPVAEATGRIANVIYNTERLLAELSP